MKKRKDELQRDASGLDERLWRADRLVVCSFVLNGQNGWVDWVGRDDGSFDAQVGLLERKGRAESMLAILLAFADSPRDLSADKEDDFVGDRCKLVLSVSAC